MSDTAQAQYLAEFAKFSPEKQRRHIGIMVRYLIALLSEKKGKPESPLDEGAIDVTPNVRRIEAE